MFLLIKSCLLGIFLANVHLLCAATGSEKVATDAIEAGRPADIYVSPGTATFRGGAWVGRENLLNLPSKILLKVEMVTSGKTLPVGEKELTNDIGSIFNKVGLASSETLSGGEKPLPLFYVLVMGIPVEKGWSVFCCGQLLEAVENERVILDKDVVFQAITWQQENLFLSPNDSLNADVKKNVAEIADAFADRYKYFQTMKKSR